MLNLKVIIVIYLVLIVAPIWISIIYDKREPVKALSWIIVVSFMPILGLIIFFIFGQNFRKRKIFDKKLKSNAHSNYHISKQLYEVNSPIYSQGQRIPQLERDIKTLLLNNNHTPLSYNNSIDILVDGEETFIAIIDAIKGAKKSIHIEYYIICSDTLGTTIANLLIEKASEGVEVRVIFDDVGSWKLSRQLINKMNKGGVKIFPFMPVLFPLFTSKINYRNHRKIIVIDGKIAFTGGINIADKYIVGTPQLGNWHDIHIKIEGNGVLSLQSIFLSDWAFVSNEKITNKNKYFYHSPKTNSGIEMQIASSGPDSDWAVIMQAFFGIITKAKESIYITTPYFTPNQAILTAIKVAALCGTDIRIIIPSKNDTRTVYWATCSYITELLEAGVKVYLYHGGFIHSKTIVADGRFCSIGSANMDVRSFEDNFEVTAFIYNKEVSQKMENIFIADLTLSKEVKLDWWRNRSRKHRMYEALARLLTPIL